MTQESRQLQQTKISIIAHKKLPPTVLQGVGKRAYVKLANKRTCHQEKALQGAEQGSREQAKGDSAGNRKHLHQNINQRPANEGCYLRKPLPALKGKSVRPEQYIKSRKVHQATIQQFCKGLSALTKCSAA